jgi:hypothetical protein
MYPNHHDFILTSQKYASETKICELAHCYNHFVKDTKTGEEYIRSPFMLVDALPEFDIYDKNNDAPLYIKKYQTQNNDQKALQADAG